MRTYENFATVGGQKVETYEFVQKLRDADSKKADNLKIIAQEGAQERMLAADADIKIVGGSRGGSKSFSMLMEGLRDIKNSNFTGILLRNEKDDLSGLIDDAYRLYSQYGTYNRSQNDMTWNFNAGGWLKFSYYAGNYEDFVTRFRGRQYAYIGIDEITQIPYKKFKYLLTCNRNSSHIRNRFWGTCNPDPNSWVRQFIDWWIGEDGYAIPERDSVIRYCFMDGDSPDKIYWGDTRDEVYLQCKEKIDRLWKPAYEKLGFSKTEMFIKSATFIRADVSENKKLLRSSPEYLANLGGQDEEQVMRDLEANWNYKPNSDDMVSETDLENMFQNAYQEGDGKRYASCDIAFEGGDNLVMWLWEGKHVQDLFVTRQDSKASISVVKAKLSEWGVEERNFTYDLNGLGQAFKGFFPEAVPFNNCAAPIAKSISEQNGLRYLYKDLKAQCAYLFYQGLKDQQFSFNNDLLELKFSGNGYSAHSLRRILMKERKCIRRNEDAADKGFVLINKKMMKLIVGHSPDFFESLFYRMIFDLKRTKARKGVWML